MPEPEGSNIDRTERRPRCVLLVVESGAVPSSLVAALDRRGLQVVITRHAPEVMLELAHPLHPDRPGSTPPVATSLVVVEPEQQARVDELREAVAAYYPATRCWRYDPHGPDGHASLTTFQDHPLDADADFDDQTLSEQPYADEADTPAYVRASGHRLRSLVVRVDPSQREPQGPLVSEEELAMLLGPEPDTLHYPHHNPRPPAAREGE